MEHGDDMKERPILFNAEMVRAVLDGRKTQTRRVVPERVLFKQVREAWPSFRQDVATACPYGVPGDRLWVRETWGVHHNHDHIRPLDLPDMAKDYFAVSFRATDADESTWVKRWRPSIHMPRWASRLLLEVTDVRVERVQEMGRADAFLEGCPLETAGPDGDIEAAHLWFRDLWESINARRGYGWSVNPWVWVVGFRVLNV